MTVQEIDGKWLARRDEWVHRITKLIDQVEEWAKAEKWAVHRTEKHLNERKTGEYTAPMLRLRSPDGGLFLTPVALHVMGGDGRVDLEAWPTGHRVRFIGEAGDWQIITDSNVPLRQPWNRQTFVQLARDLQSL